MYFAVQVCESNFLFKRHYKNFYESFKTWVMDQYPSTEKPTEEEWEEIMVANAINYQEHGSDEADVTHQEIDSDYLNVVLLNDATM